MSAEIVASENRAIQREAEAKADSDRKFAELKEEFAKSEIRAERRFGELKAEISESQSKTIRWALAIGVFAVGAITVLDRLFS